MNNELMNDYELKEFVTELNKEAQK